MSLAFSTGLIYWALGIEPFLSTVAVLPNVAFQLVIALTQADWVLLILAGLVVFLLLFSAGLRDHIIGPRVLYWRVVKVLRSSLPSALYGLTAQLQYSLWDRKLPIATRNRVAISTSAALSGAAPLLN